ncbi:MAG: HEAT repeat domain-containing protein [Myxococcales bacterium]|nr:HEAT repeat domain-containing protein [Myxococcales bacterium]
MGILDFFGGSPADKALKLKAKVTQKYGDPTARQKAIDQLGEMKVKEAAGVLLARFTINVDPQSTDIEEKEHVFELVCAFAQDAVEPVKEFLRKTDLGSSWAVRLLSAILPEEQVIGIATEMLAKLGAEYTRNPEKKAVLLHFVEGKTDPRIGPAVLPFLEDMADDIKIAALKVLGPLKLEAAREPILQLLASEETARRVKTAALQALHDAGFGVQGYREKVEAAILEPYFVDKSGVVKRRG